ncbi:hypothetical protein WN55_05105 [Dufourea novaeangliae]|uniref:Uncharacterized protein n=1 Tax=Dufourea novaeangliae TaxID=178035 RepID=A0A154PNX0_DUFNO|nr:hypothetical protein WN55_05105 [Dufourea novaeangliae]
MQLDAVDEPSKYVLVNPGGRTRAARKRIQVDGLSGWCRIGPADQYVRTTILFLTCSELFLERNFALGVPFD